MASVESSISKSSSLSESPELAVNSAASSESTVVEKAAPKAKTANSVSFIDRFLNLLSSVQFGIVLLILLIVACMIGMLIQQIELETFSGYYAELTPAEKTVYGRLGFFDIYHVWYFNLLLLLLSLNIILASIDHFPAAWSFITKKKLKASPMFAMSQKFREKAELPGVDRQRLTERASKAARAMGFKVRVTEEDSRTTIFAERGVWNRLGAYVVHIGLLTIFLGGFLTSRGFTGSMPIAPDETGNRMFKQTFNIDGSNQHSIGTQELQLPFSVEGVDIQQKPIRKEGGVDAGNSLDWLTRIRINDPETGKTTDALIHMNSPFDYRGYRLFQASFNSLGSARSVKIKAMPTGGGEAQEVTIPRNGQTKLADGTVLIYREFNPAFTVDREGRVDIGSSEYENPAAHLDVIYPDGDNRDVWVFTESGRTMLEQAPFLKSKFGDTGAKQFVLADFEKVPTAHHLSIQYDPGVKVVYAGFTLLCVTLMLVFFFSHQRLWIVVEDGKVTLGGDANRNRLGFEDRVKRMAAFIQTGQKAQPAS